MAFILAYKNPEKQRLQRFQIAAMILLLPLGLFGGSKAYGEYASYQAADKEYIAGEQLMDANKWTEAAGHLRTAVDRYPYHYAAWDALSTCHFMSGDKTKSREILEEGLSHLPQEGRLHRELGQAYHDNGAHDKELASLEQALVLLPDDPFVVHLHKRAKACRESGKSEQKSPE